MITYAKNPAELAILTNPQKPKTAMKQTAKKGGTKRRTTSRRNPSVNYMKTAKDLLIPAAGILGGQIIASQATRIAEGFVPDSLGYAKKAIPAGLPLLVGGALLVLTKNATLKYVGIGMGASGISAGVKQFAPSLGGYVPLADRLADMMPGNTRFLAGNPAPMPLPAPVTEYQPVAGYEESYDDFDYDLI